MDIWTDAYIEGEIKRETDKYVNTYLHLAIALHIDKRDTTTKVFVPE